MLRLHNTLSHQTEVFDKAPGEVVSLYTCGPTVYDYAHIGNLRAFIFDDTLRRTLEAAGLTVKHVMNITDVGHLVADEDESVISDDKLEKGALREGKSVWDVAEGYSEAFKQDMAALNVLPPNGYSDPRRHDNYARATDFIAEQIAMVTLLLDKGFAYQTKQAIYFDVTKLSDYGKLSGQSLADKEVAVRDDVVTDSDKHHPQDFAVWFFTVGHFADHTMRWPSPWGEGFPGWHLECSAIIHATLGEPIDIHTGGVDHIGTHHTNEIAQTEAAFGKPLAKFWLHNQFILIDGGKMSKSKNNFYTLRDLTAKGFKPVVYRFRVLQSHYRSELNFTWDSLAAAQTALLRVYGLADLASQATDDSTSDIDLADFQKRFESAMMDDLNTPQALAIPFELTDKLATRALPSKSQLGSLVEVIERYLGLGLTERPALTSEQQDLLAGREQARAARDYAAADNHRADLAKLGLEVKDTSFGARWQRTSII